ncbi:MULTISPECIES: hypothetical protein [Bradyrhizobium]|jgi:hypothetical protein|uniref:hypothetical protein n=1 Tax=Bradyrhizobium TaxID=374 RepID=UPI00041ACCBD|nr:MULTISPECIES: hypothetical protein [Bradyrhizobium]KQT26690.1 hypothetical protein ASG57_18960 [Bradyrhizobium sp. Leaf396]
MNHSIYTAEKATHLKVVAAGLLAGIAIVAATLSVRFAESELSPLSARHVHQAHLVQTPTEMAQR